MIILLKAWLVIMSLFIGMLFLAALVSNQVFSVGRVLVGV